MSKNAFILSGKIERLANGDKVSFFTLAVVMGEFTRYIPVKYFGDLEGDFDIYEGDCVVVRGEICMSNYNREYYEPELVVTEVKKSTQKKSTQKKSTQKKSTARKAVKNDEDYSDFEDDEDLPFKEGK